MTRRTPLRVAPALPLLAAVAVALGVLWYALALGARAVGGADSYGYVSQAELWREGRLRIRQDIAASVPWPHADLTFAPLGYTPAGNHEIVPIYRQDCRSSWRCSRRSAARKARTTSRRWPRRPSSC